MHLTRSYLFGLLSTASLLAWLTGGCSNATDNGAAGVGGTGNPAVGAGGVAGTAAGIGGAAVGAGGMTVGAGGTAGVAVGAGGASAGSAAVGMGGATAGAAGTGTAGSAGTTANPDIDCSAPVLITNPIIADFEAYDGIASADGWEFNFNAPVDMPGTVYAGLYALDEDPPSGSYSLLFVDGEVGWGLQAANSASQDWGGGFGIWSGCVNASAFDGIQISVQGQSGPDAVASVGLVTLTGDVAYEFSLTTAWQTLTIPFSSFVSATGTTTDGSMIAGFRAAVNNAYMPLDSEDPNSEFVPNPAPYSLTIDNMQFYTAAP